MEQHGRGDDAELVFITHESQEAAVRATIEALGELDAVTRVNSLLRVVGG